VDRHPTVKMLALSFLLLIGVTLIAEGVGQHISKGHVYFAVAFAVFVEMLNLRGQAVASCVESAVSPKPLRIGTIPAAPNPSPSVPLPVQSVGYNPLARLPRVCHGVCSPAVSQSHIGTPRTQSLKPPPGSPASVESEG